MMNILIAHDRPTMADEIKAVIERSDLRVSTIDVSYDYVGTRDFLMSATYDVMILDLTLPHILDRGEPSHGVVENLLAELMSPGALNVPGDLIGITRDSTALREIAANIGPHLMAIIEESDEEKGGWVVPLIQRLSYVETSRAARLKSTYQHYDVDVAIIVALDKELAPFHDIFELEPISTSAETFEFTFNDKTDAVRRGIACSIGRPGTASAASKTQSVVTLYRPRLVLMSGFCGGVKGKVKLGDLVLFEQVFDWDAGKWKTDPEQEAAFLARPEPIGIRGSQTHAVSRKMVQDGLQDGQRRIARARELSPKLKEAPEIHLEAAASGSSVVSDVDIRAQISSLNEDIAAVDMESYGLYHASYHTVVRRPEMLCVKAVADYCDVRKRDKVHKACCYLSAEVCADVMMRYWDFG